MLIESRSRTTEGAETEAELAARRSLFAGVRTRVLVFFLILLVISTAASVLVLREVLISRIGDQVEKQLVPHVDTLRNLSANGRPADGRPFESLDQLFDTYLAQSAPPPDGALVTYIGGQRYDQLVSEPTATGLEFAFDDVATGETPASGTIDSSLGEAQYIAVPVSGGGEAGTLVVAALTAAERDQVESAVRIAIGVSIVVLLLASLFIWLAAGRTVVPRSGALRGPPGRSRRPISPGRIPVRGNDEIAELGRTFNGMLDRIETAFAGQKDFITDVSHELRTPITVIRGHLETLGDSAEEREEATLVIQDELDRMNRYVDDLLLLTKAVRPDFLRLAPVDLDLFTHDLMAKVGEPGRSRLAAR